MTANAPINTATLVDDDAGRNVVYHTGLENRPRRSGVLLRWSEQTVLVRLKGSDLTSACDPARVELV